MNLSQQQHANFQPENQNLSNPGYVPPGFVQTDVALQDARTELNYKIKDIENRLEKGGYLVFKIWVWIMIILTSLAKIGFILLLATLLFRNGTRVFYVNRIIIWLIISQIWLIISNLMVIKAITNRELSAAKKGLVLTILFAYFYVTVISFFSYGTSSSEREQTFDIFIAPIILPICFQMFGAFKVKDILEKRDALTRKLDTNPSESFCV